MQKSEAIGELVTALAKAQKAYKPLIKDSTNPYYNSKYADLAAVIESTKDGLADNNLAVVQLPSFENGKVVITTILAHGSGQFLQEELALDPPSVKDKNTGEVIFKTDPQSVALTVTYGRRVGYQAIVGVAAEDEDDGNAASGKTVTQPQSQPKVNQTPAKPKNNPRPNENVQKTDNFDSKENTTIAYPSKEEMTAIKKQVREWTEKTDKEKLVAFIRKTANQQDSNKIPKATWETIFKLLEAAEKNDTLDKLIGGETNE